MSTNVYKNLLHSHLEKQHRRDFDDNTCENVDTICNNSGTRSLVKPFHFYFPEISKTSEDLENIVPKIRGILSERQQDYDNTDTDRLIVPNLSGKIKAIFELLQNFYALDATAKTETVLECFLDYDICNYPDSVSVKKEFPKIKIREYRGKGSIQSICRSRLIFNYTCQMSDVTGEELQKLLFLLPFLNNELHSAAKTCATDFNLEFHDLQAKLNSGKTLNIKQQQRLVFLQRIQNGEIEAPTAKVIIPFLKAYLQSPYVRVISVRSFTPFNVNTIMYNAERDGKQSDFAYVKPLPYEINEFTGFPFSHIPKEVLEANWKYVRNFQENDYVKFVKDWVKMTLCDNDRVKYYYFMSFIMDIFQNPMVKPMHCPLFFGPQGSGKSWFFENIMKPLLGDALFVQGCRLEHFFGNFNSLINRKLLILIEENSFNGDYQNQIKQYITGNSVIIREMRKDAKQSENYSRFVFCSNSVCEKNANIDINERRIVYMKTKIADKDALHAAMDFLLSKEKGLLQQNFMLQALFYEFAYRPEKLESYKTKSNYKIGMAPLWAYNDLSLTELGNTTVSIFIRELLATGTTFNNVLISTSEIISTEAAQITKEFFPDEESQNYKLLKRNVENWPKMVSQLGMYKKYCDFVKNHNQSGFAKNERNFWEEISDIFPNLEKDIILDDNLKVTNDGWGNMMFEGTAAANNYNIHRTDIQNLVKLPSYIECCQSYLSSVRIPLTSENIAKYFLRKTY
ncbi:hypothetical protein KC460_05170, partial [Candidatus Dependentiae bacterium]|nr:hypothetical protein [Candidatus Dependentiae bacterium]